MQIFISFRSITFVLTWCVFDFVKVFKFLTFGLGVGATTLSTPRIEIVDLANERQSHNSVSRSSEITERGIREIR